MGKSDSSVGKLTLVTFTGPDDLVDPKQLKTYQQAFPFIEWGILIYPPRTGTHRYPSPEWIERFLDSRPAQTAVHLCGQAVHDFIAQKPDVYQLASRFNRVQLNFFHKKSPVDVAALDTTARQFGRPVIVPHNPGNQEAVEQLTAPNIQILFDRSGGKGVAPDVWPEPIVGRKCFYAGGLRPGNIRTELPRIFAAAGGKPVGIDMETGVRTETDEFSFPLVREVAQSTAELAGLRVNREFLCKL